ncbi:MAG: rhodanese-like domain-containing protein [Desulfobacterales bacterium]|nr:rhodanese-like domain-containing protein [Desulfobacterales bacterium]
MRKSYLLICAAIILIISLSPVSGDEGYKEINTLELKKWMDAEDKPILVNSLSPIEFGESYIPGAICIPMELMQVSQLIPADLNKPIVFYCYGPECMKSKIASDIAIKMGHENIYWYREGIEGWKKAGYGTQYNLELPKEPLPPIEPSELFQRLQNKEEIILVDIRDEATRKKLGKISGVTIHLPLYRLHNLYRELPRNKLLVVYDSKGQQSSTACRYLFIRHFDKVTWLKGGIEAWSQEKLPVE